MRVVVVVAGLPPSYPPPPPFSHATTVVVMGTVAGGISWHPQCRTVMVVPRHVADGVGHVSGSAAQMVVYVVDTMTGDMLIDDDDDDVGDGVSVVVD